VRRGEQPAGLRGQLSRRVDRRRYRIDLAQGPAELLARLVRGTQPLAANVGLETVGQLSAVEDPRRAQVVEQVLGAGSVTEQRAARQREQPPAQRGVPERQLTLDRDLDPVLLEHPLDQSAGRSE
jgi:hypothetical protein